VSLHLSRRNQDFRFEKDCRSLQRWRRVRPPSRGLHRSRVDWLSDPNGLSTRAAAPRHDRRRARWTDRRRRRPGVKDRKRHQGQVLHHRVCPGLFEHAQRASGSPPVRDRLGRDVVTDQKKDRPSVPSLLLTDKVGRSSLRFGVDAFGRRHRLTGQDQNQSAQCCGEGAAVAGETAPW
jgi:hypothetical protein